jgi:lipoate-protein ligase B
MQGVLIVELAETTKKTLIIHDCGIVVFDDILKLQHELHEKRRLGQIANTIIVVEHLPVITLGARQSANRLLVSADYLKGKSIDLVNIRRGGGVTAHNPGQVVFYPILQLADFGLGISQYVRELESVGIELLSRFGVDAARCKGRPGLWVGQKKIASIGVRLSKGVTYHGMAINVQNDLSIFEHIVPCGLDGVQITSILNETGNAIPTNDIKLSLVSILKEHFS